MASAKRPASNSFGSSQIVVKRQKSSTDINGKAVTVANGHSSSSGAIIQSVRLRSRMPGLENVLNYDSEGGRLMGSVFLGPTNKWTTGAHHGAHR